jgi:hypothetical protein
VILFASDNHYGAYPGRNLYEEIQASYDIEFREDDWSCFETTLSERYELIVLNMIAATCEVPQPSECAGRELRNYLLAGGSLLLLHGASAAFWHEAWWREIVGLRWVRPGDPDAVPKSSHPRRPYEVTVSRSRHPLCKKLKPVSLPTDEIYIHLEQTCPIYSLMETTTDEGTFVQAYESTTPWGGRILAYLPGHLPEVVRAPDMVHNVRVLLDDLLGA